MPKTRYCPPARLADRVSPRRLAPPTPAPEFVELVDRELADARARSFELLGRPDPRRGRRGPEPLPTVAATKRYTHGCGGCGCPLDERTTGCRNCGSRHAMRRSAARRRAVLASR